MLTQEQILQNIADNIQYFEARTDADDPWGERDIMKLSIGCTLYFYNGHKPEIRALMPQLVKSFYDQFGQYFTGGYMHNKENQTSYGKLTPKLLEKCFNPKSWQDIDEKMDFYWGMPDLESTLGFTLSILLQDEYTMWDALSSIQLAIPYNQLKLLDPWLVFIKQICQHIPMHCGNVGYYSSLPDQYHAYEEYQPPIAYRFFGCDIDSGSRISMNYPPPRHQRHQLVDHSRSYLHSANGWSGQTDASRHHSEFRGGACR